MDILSGLESLPNIVDLFRYKISNILIISILILVYIFLELNYRRINQKYYKINTKYFTKYNLKIFVFVAVFIYLSLFLITMLFKCMLIDFGVYSCIYLFLIILLIVALLAIYFSKIILNNLGKQFEEKEELNTICKMVLFIVLAIIYFIIMNYIIKKSFIKSLKLFLGICFFIELSTMYNFRKSMDNTSEIKLRLNPIFIGFNIMYFTGLIFIIIISISSYSNVDTYIKEIKKIEFNLYDIDESFSTISYKDKEFLYKANESIENVYHIKDDIKNWKFNDFNNYYNSEIMMTNKDNSYNVKSKIYNSLKLTLMSLMVLHFITDYMLIIEIILCSILLAIILFSVNKNKNDPKFKKTYEYIDKPGLMKEVVITEYKDKLVVMDGLLYNNNLYLDRTNYKIIDLSDKPKLAQEKFNSIIFDMMDYFIPVIIIDYCGKETKDRVDISFKKMKETLRLKIYDNSFNLNEIEISCDVSFKNNCMIIKSEIKHILETIYGINNFKFKLEESAKKNFSIDENTGEITINLDLK